MVKRVTSENKHVDHEELILTKEQTQEREKRLAIKNVKVRAAMGFFILWSVVTTMMLGHSYTIVLVTGIGWVMYFEIMSKI